MPIFWRMVRRVRRDRAAARRTLSSSLLISTMSALAMETSVPEPRAIPTSARTSAGASLTPSPTMATRRPPACSRRITSSFCSGSTSAITSMPPRRRAIASAARRRSPLSMVTRMPSPFSAAIRAVASSRTRSSMATSALSRPSTAKRRELMPFSSRRIASASNAGSIRTPRCTSHSLVPASSSRPSSMPRTPCPGNAWNALIPGSSLSIPNASARRPMAAATGCSEACSSAASGISSSRMAGPGRSPADQRSSPERNPVTCICPSVRVPVLSNTKWSMEERVSSTSPFLTRIPLRAPAPEATATAIGVARPKAQGQVMISTAVAAIRACSTPLPYHHRKVARASPRVTATNQGTMRSAVRWIGALLAWASSTSRMMRPRAVSCSAPSTRTRSRPFPLMVPAETRSPTPFSTPADSPVSMDSSTALPPSRMVPSTGTRSPGRITTVSPGLTVRIGTIASSPFFSTVATRGCRSSRRWVAATAWRLEMASR